MRKATFFDRDGVLNIDSGYVGTTEQFCWLPGAKETLQRLTLLGYTNIVVTNQSGVARGYYTEEAVRQLHRWMCSEVARAGGNIAAVYYCPYLEGALIPAYNKKSDWRKPEPGMVLQACKDYDIDKTRSFLIGDSVRDIQCGQRAGVESYLFMGDNLYEFVNRILAERKKRGII